MRSLVFRVLRYSGVPWLLRVTVQRRRATIILYHDPSPATVEEHLRALSRRYLVFSLPELVSALADSAAVVPRKCLVVTFDDGYVGNYALLDVFRRYGVRPTFFVCTGLVGTNRGFWFRHSEDVETLKRVPDDERLRRLAAEGFNPDAAVPIREAMSADELRKLSATADIQAHTVSHPILTRCTEERARDEIRGAKRHLEERFGLTVYAIAYPNGDYDDEIMSLAREAGYHCALAAGGGTNPRDVDVFRLKRITIDDADGVDELLVKASGLWQIFRLIRRSLNDRARGGRPRRT
jgi:peptidoglycan/xylan/chitin deacetylase (PgdA/CDA1 family)